MELERYIIERATVRCDDDSPREIEERELGLRVLLWMRKATPDFTSLLEAKLAAREFPIQDRGWHYRYRITREVQIGSFPTGRPRWGAGLVVIHCVRCEDDGYLDESTQTVPVYCNCPRGRLAEKKVTS